MTNKRLKLVTLLFALTFLVGAAFAATNGVLVFGGTVRVNSVDMPQEARLEFISAGGPAVVHFGSLTYEIVEDAGRQLLNFDMVVNWPISAPPYPHMPGEISIGFEVKNTGNVPIELVGFDIVEGRPFYTIWLQQIIENRLNLFYFPDSQTPNQNMTIAPGEVIIGALHPWPRYFSAEIPDEFNELTFTASVALNYRQAR